MSWFSSLGDAIKAAWQSLFGGGNIGSTTTSSNTTSSRTGVSRTVSGATSTSRLTSTGGPGKSQNISLKLKFVNSSGGEPQEIIINKETASDTIIYNDFDHTQTSMINYVIEHKSFDWAPDGVLVSPTSSALLDESFFEAFIATFDVSAANAIIEEVNILTNYDGENNTKKTSKTIFSRITDEDGLAQNNFSEEEFLLWKNDNLPFAGKVLALDTIDYPVSNNILSFDYYTKYDRPSDLTQEEIEKLNIYNKGSFAAATGATSTEEDNGTTQTASSTGNGSRSDGGGSSSSSGGRRGGGSSSSSTTRSSSTSNTSETSGGSTSRGNSSGTRVTQSTSRSSSVSRSSARSSVARKTNDTYCFEEDKTTGEYIYIPLSNIEITIEVKLKIDNLTKLSINLFPPAIKNKLFFVPDIKNLLFLNVIKEIPFDVDIKSYFKIYSLALTCITKITEDENLISKKITKSIIYETVPVIGDDNPNFKVTVQELPDINVYKYNIQFKKSAFTDGTNAVSDMALEFDQSGDENLEKILNDTQYSGEELYDYECAVKVFSNNTAVGKVSKSALENILIGKPIDGGVFEIARYKLKEDCKEFGDIHVFYGNVHLRKTGDKIKYTTEIEGDELIVYIKYDPYFGEGEVTSLKTEYLNLYDYICVNMDNVIELDINEIDKSTPIKITNTSSIVQNSDVVFSSNINIPLINLTDETVFIDAAQNGNKLQHYTYVTTLSEASTTTYLGVRAYKKHSEHYEVSASEEISKLNIGGLTYNVPAQLVLLTPYTTQETIYSFRNGVQTMQLNKTNVGFNFDKTNKKLSIRDILPNYHLSYEYLVDGKESSNPNDYNLKFYGLREEKGWVRTEIPNEISLLSPTEKQSYLFTLSYIKKTENPSVNNLSYYPLDGISENQTIYNNIYINEYSTESDNVVSSLREQTIFEEKYSLITQPNDWKNDDNLYQKTTAYIKLPISSVSLTDFKTVIRNYYDRLELINNEIPDPENNTNPIYSQTEESLLNSVYHKYSSISKEYNPYTLDDIKNIENVPYNLYYRSTYFIKLPQQEYVNHQETAYKMDLNITTISNPTIADGMIYAHYNQGFTYMPLYMGIKYDGSIQYYTDGGYYLIDFEDLDYRKEPRPTNSDIADKQIFVKQKYKNIEDLSQENFDKDYVSKGYKFYRKVNTVKYIPIGNNQTIYDLDLSGDVVYADENKKIISKHDIDSIYYKASTDPDAWYAIDSAEIIFRENNQNIHSTITKDDNIRTYMLKEMNTDSEHGFKGIHYIVDFDGDFVEVKYEDIANEVASLPTGTKISTYYINKEGYNEFEVSENTFLTDILVDGPNNLYKNYLYYGYNFKFYLKGKSKIPVDKIKSYVEDDHSKIYINASRLFKNVDTLPTFTSSDEVQLTGKKSSILLEIEKSGNNTGIIKANNFSGTNPIIYCNIEPQYVSSFDIHNNINKKYYTTKNYKLSFGEITLDDKKDLTNISSIDVANKKITLNSLLPESEGYNIDYDSLRFYKNGIYAYTLTHLAHGLTNASSIISYIEPELAGNNPTNAYTYSYEVLMSSKFFYSSYTVNDGINIGKDGSYFTNISVFDGKTGLTNKMLYLTPHIYTVTNYKYTYTHINDTVLVTKDMDLSNISENEYHNYYVVDSKNPEEKIELDKNTKTPAWWFSYCTKNTRFSLYTKLVEVGETEYNGQIINNTYQLFDPYLNIPYTIKYNGNIYGLIFKENPYIVHDSSYFLVTAPKINTTFPNTSSKRFTYCCWEDESTVAPYYVPSNHSGDEVDQKVYQIIGETYNKDNDNGDGDIYDKDDANFLKAKHYYENLNLNEKIRKIYVKYLPCEYEYEVVPLQEFIYKSKGIDDNVFQNRESIPYELKEKNAFELANAKKINFTGTYTWIAPEFSYISTYELSTNSYNSDEKTYIYKSKKIISRSGYWSKDYIEEEVPFKISSYNFYPKNEISSVNITYSFIPNSYILMSEIYHPEISYDYLVNDIYEYYKYTYIINGIEKDYPLNGEIILNPDNTYSGIISVFDKAINETDFENNTDDITLVSYNGISQIKVKLYRKLDIAVNSNVKNIVHQNAYTSYNWYSYTQATPLTNEKVPYLYKKEIIPAHTKKVQYWNKETNSYAVKEIIDSYSYYSYEYTYEVIPFKVASYIFTDDLRISNFYDLGAYIISLKDGITGVLGEQTKATKDLTTKITGSVDDLISLGQEISETWNSNYSTHSEILNSTLVTSRNELKSNLTNLSQILDTSIDDFNKKSTDAITYLNESVSSYIDTQNNLLNNRLDDLNQTHAAKMEELSGYVHNDLIGTDSFEIVSTNTEWTYTYYKHGTYILSSENESNNIVSVDSLGKIFKNSMFSDYEHYKVTYNSDGSFTKITYSGEQGIAEILANFTTQEKLPDYNQFMVKLVPAMFANIDFEGHYEIQYDAYGNVISTMKRNPVNVAKSTIFRADTLWKELKKKGIVE